MVLDRADVVVIGGGVTGLSTAWWLRKAGVDVVVVEKGIVGWEASGRNGGMVSARGQEPPVVPLAKESLRLWPTMDEELGYPTEFVGKGYLNAVLYEEGVPGMHEAQRTYQGHGIPCQVLSPEEVRELVPPISPRCLGGLFIPHAGHVNPQRATQAFAWAVLDRGGRIYQETTVTGITVSRGRVAAVETTRGTILTETVVDAAGPQTAHIAAMVGVHVPLAPARVEIIATVPLPPLFQVALSGNGLYGRQALRGNLLYGGGPHEWTDVAPAGEPAKPNTPLIRHIARRLAELLPSLEGVRVLRSWAGIVEQTPDYYPIIDRVGEPQGFIVATASAHGFGLSPATGKAISELVTKGESSIDISGLRLDRFAALEPDWRERRNWVAGAYNT